jgi:hypothetical protein
MGRLQGVPREGLVQGWRNGGPAARLFGVPNRVRMGRRDAANGSRARGGAGFSPNLRENYSSRQLDAAPPSTMVLG